MVNSSSHNLINNIMKEFIEKALPVLEKTDLTIVMAYDAGSVTLSIIPKPKNADNSFTAPPLIVSGEVEKFGEKGIDYIISVLSKSVPSLANAVSFEKQVKQIEEQSKKKVEDKSKSKVVKKSEPKEGLFGAVKDDNDQEGEMDNE